MNLATNKWLPAFLVLCCTVLLLPACGGKKPLTEEEQAYLEEAMLTADEMFSLRQVENMPEDIREELKAMYLEEGYNRAGAKVVAVHYVPSRMNESQKFLGGVVGTELERSRIRANDRGVEIELRYTVFGNKNNTREWVTLRQRPNNEQWMEDNGGRFVIISHQVKM